MPSDSGTSQIYRLKFIPDALVEWQKLDGSIKELFRKALKKRLVQPLQPGSRLHGDLNLCYKIKLKKQGYRLVYTVEDDQLVVLVLAIDKREDLAAYHSAMLRLVKK
jgi:mRNA interferase RelE/StbE